MDNTDNQLRTTIPHFYLNDLVIRQRNPTLSVPNPTALMPTWHNCDPVRLSDAQLLIHKYRDYQSRGFLVLTVTLSTRVRSDAIAASEKFSCMWTKHFCEKLEKRLPKNRVRALLDHDYQIEKSNFEHQKYDLALQDDKLILAAHRSRIETLRRKGWRSTPDNANELHRSGIWHFHGLVAVDPLVADRFWSNDSLNHHLYNDLHSFELAGRYRPFRITSFLIEPIRSLDAWVSYIRKRRQEKIAIV